MAHARVQNRSMRITTRGPTGAMLLELAEISQDPGQCLVIVVRAAIPPLVEPDPIVSHLGHPMNAGGP